MRKPQNYASFKLNYSLWYKKYVTIIHPPRKTSHYFTLDSRY